MAPTTDESGAHSIIKKEIQDCSKSEKLKNSGTIFRVGSRIRRLHERHFTCELISLGLYDRDRYKPETESDKQKTESDKKKTEGDTQCQTEQGIRGLKEPTATERAENFRITIVTAFLMDLEMTNKWPDVCEAVTGNAREMMHLYREVDVDIDINDPDEVDEVDSMHKEVQGILTLDAVFLTCFIMFGVINLGRPDEQSPSAICLSDNVRIFRKQFRSVKTIYEKESSSTIGILREDVVKLENQIPLSLLVNVLDLAMKNSKVQYKSPLSKVQHKSPLPDPAAGRPSDPELGAGSSDTAAVKPSESLLSSVIASFICDRYHFCIPGFISTTKSSRDKSTSKSCGYKSTSKPPRANKSREHIEEIDFHECNHLLDCLYVAMTRTPVDPLRVTKPPASQDDGDHENHEDLGDLGIIPSATQLVGAGIEIRGKPGQYREVRFKIGMFGLKATLSLPVIESLGRDTERSWRNLAAYEDERPVFHKDSKDANDNDFRAYLEFMDQLIDSKDDVALLRSGKLPVIRKTGLGSDKNVAELFNTMLRGKLQDHPPIPWKRWDILKEDINTFYNNEARRGTLEFIDTYFGKWWLTLSLFAASFLLVLTVIQTTFALLAYYDPP